MKTAEDRAEKIIIEFTTDPNHLFLETLDEEDCEILQELITGEIKKAIAEERERCAKLAEEFKDLGIAEMIRKGYEPIIPIPNP